MNGNEVNSKFEVVKRNSVVKEHRKINFDHLNYLRLWEQILRRQKKVAAGETDETIGEDKTFFNDNIKKTLKDMRKLEEKQTNDNFQGKQSSVVKSAKPRIVGVILAEMGSSMSSSVGDRRANALRRSQRKSLTGACSNIDKVLKALKTYKGTEDSEEYKNMKIRIIQIEKNLQNKLAEPQQQFKTLHEITQQKLRNAFETLEKKTLDNTEAARTKEVILNRNGITPSSPDFRKSIEELDTQEHQNKSVEKDAIPFQSPTSETKRKSLLLLMSKFGLPKRESKNSTSEPEDQETTVEVHKSPGATRKSIMKYGVPVLPSPPHNTPPKLVSFNTPDHFEDTLLRHERRLKIIKQDIANLEIRISEFIGKKDGKHYNNLKLSLVQMSNELQEMNEEELFDQVDMCKNYIKSCLNFLESKALGEDDVDDEIFTNYTDSKIYGSTHDLLEGHNVRTTAI